MPVSNPYDAGEDVHELAEALAALIPLPERGEGDDGCGDYLYRARLIAEFIAALDARYGKTAPTTPHTTPLTKLDRPEVQKPKRRRNRCIQCDHAGAPFIENIGDFCHSECQEAYMKENP